MPTIEHDQIVFRFEHLHRDALFMIDCQRTLRIPDTEATYRLPPGLGSFPLRHVEDYADGLPEKAVRRGGAILPIWQSEAMWLNFASYMTTVNDRDVFANVKFPFAIKVAAGKINAVTGEAWTAPLSAAPQDYMVAPDQPWLDGFAVEKGVVRQFVAMPLGQGFSAEEQLTGEAEWGGLQISVTPLKPDHWKRYCDDQLDAERRQREDEMSRMLCSVMACEGAPMGLAPGGRMRQHIYDDPFGLDAWDQEATQRVFLHLCHGKDWYDLTGELPKHMPPSAETYTNAGLPWFDHLRADLDALKGSETLAALKSVAALKEEAGSPEPETDILGALAMKMIQSD